MDNVEDTLQDAADIGDALSRNLQAPGIDADEDDLLAELEELEQDELTKDLGAISMPTASSASNADTLSSMPSAPASFPAAPSNAVQMTDEERELAELEAAMAM